MIELTLPWPSQNLSQNARVHWAVKADAVQYARRLAFLLARQAGWTAATKLPEGRLDLWIEFFPPTRRRPDDDNMHGRVKSYRDGIADALGIDDKRFRSHLDVRDEVRKGGQVVMRITWGSDINQGEQGDNHERSA